MVGLGLGVRLLLVAVVLCFLADGAQASYYSYRSYTYRSYSYRSYTYRSYRYRSYTYGTTSGGSSNLGLALGATFGVIFVVCVIVAVIFICHKSSTRRSRVSATTSAPVKMTPVVTTTTTSGQLPHYTYPPAGQGFAPPPPPSYDAVYPPVAQPNGANLPPIAPNPFEAATFPHSNPAYPPPS